MDNYKQNSPYWDKHGFPVQKDGDGGDTAQRVGMWYFGLWLGGMGQCNGLLNLAVQMDISKNDTPQWVRHPYQGDDFRPPETFRRDPKSFTRDQQDVLMIALGACDHRHLVWKTFKAHAKRFGKYQNKDMANPQTLSVYIRAMKWSWLKWLLYITDLGLVFSSWNRRKWNPDHTDDLNHICRMLQAVEIMDTPTARWARRTYIKYRPINMGNTVLGEETPVMGALAWYFREEAGGNPAFVELFREPCLLHLADKGEP